MISKCIGQRVEVIYQDGKGQLTQRIVTVLSVDDGHSKVYDPSKRATRTLSLGRILAVMPMNGRRST